MKSNREYNNPPNRQDIDHLRVSIQKEKEALLSMFLANASQGELSEQFKRIDELNARINNCNEH